jgi:hypothetical protein
MEFFKKLFTSFTSGVHDTSKSGAVNTTDVVKVVRTALLVGVASALTYFTGAVNPENLGVYGVFLVPVATAALDLLNKYIKGNK